MLIEISSDQFRVKTIKFGPSLNVVLGDDNATNSIGKSSLLMVIDFAFGGSALITHNTDIVQELGHHDYYFTFNFDDELFRFRRGTYQPEIIYRIEGEYAESQPIELEEFTAFLKASYGIDGKDISFRGLVGLFSRVWGKENLDVHKPLHVVHNQRARDCVETLIRIFDRYAPIRTLATELKEKEKAGDAMRRAFANRIIPKIRKRDYQTNEQRISEVENEIGDIKDNLARFATNIAEVANREVRELKVQKDELLSTRLQLETKLNRIQGNLAENRYIKSRHFETIKKFIPSINVERLELVDQFHSGLAKALKSEFENAAKELQYQVDEIDSELEEINSEMASTLSSLDDPAHIIDRVYELTERLNTAKEENDYYDSNEEIKNNVADLKKRLSAEKDQALAYIEAAINDSVNRIVARVFEVGRKSPTIAFSETNYKYEVFEDTGTGTAYASLLVLDLSVFSLTFLPCVTHDSILFKNIENDSVSKLFEIYLESEKQSFVAIDEVDKYGSSVAEKLRDRAAVHLKDDAVLYIKDWRQNAEKNAR